MKNVNDLKDQMKNPQGGHEVAVIEGEKGIQALVERNESKFINLLGGRTKALAFQQSLVSAICDNPKLRNCTENSIVKSAITMAQLGMTPNTALGRAYLVPYGNECTFQIGYKGLRELFYRSALAKGVKAWLVYENDHFDDHDEYNKYPEFVKAEGNRGNLRLVFCVAELATGYIIYEKMTVREIEEHKLKYVKSWRYKDSGWQTNYPAQARKTVLIKVLKDCPMEEVQQAITQEEETYHKEEPVGDMMGEGEVKNPNEILVLNDIDLVRTSISSCYRDLMAFLKDEWTIDYIMEHNRLFLGVQDAKKCDDIDKLKALLTDLESRIDKIEQEV